MSFCSLIKGITLKIRMLCLVLIYSILVNVSMCLDLSLLISTTTVSVSLAWTPLRHRYDRLFNVPGCPFQACPSHPSGSDSYGWRGCIGMSGGIVASGRQAIHRTASLWDCCSWLNFRHFDDVVFNLRVLLILIVTSTWPCPGINVDGKTFLTKLFCILSVFFF